jgi:hypothetical protein
MNQAILEAAIATRKKFLPIPDIFWCIAEQNNRKGQSCALGLCSPELSVVGATHEDHKNLLLAFYTKEVTIVRVHSRNAYEKGDTVRGTKSVVSINNGETLEYNQLTPKARILAALDDIIAEETPKPVYEDITTELAVLPKDETADVVLQPC